MDPENDHARPGDQTGSGSGRGYSDTGCATGNRDHTARSSAKPSRGAFRHDWLRAPADYYESEGLRLVGAGPWRSGLCVFHDETTESLRVNIEHGGYRCMGCGETGGDILAFHMARYGLTFVEAAKALGAWDEGAAAPPRQPQPFGMSPAELDDVLFIELHVLLQCVSRRRSDRLSPRLGPMPPEWRAEPPASGYWPRELKAATRVEKLLGAIYSDELRGVSPCR
ncbi:MAG: hypothetical protein KDH88_17600 [Chromatiales bacterium]|nr:hypothetical protein [Chromatiales bacterium]